MNVAFSTLTVVWWDDLGYGYICVKYNIFLPYGQRNPNLCWTSFLGDGNISATWLESDFGDWNIFPLAPCFEPHPPHGVNWISARKFAYRNPSRPHSGVQSTSCHPHHYTRSPNTLSTLCTSLHRLMQTYPVQAWPCPGASTNHCASPASSRVVANIFYGMFMTFLVQRRRHTSD